MEVSSDGPWEEGSNGNHGATSQRGFPKTCHHHPGSLRKLFPEPCAPREWLPPEPPRTPRSSANPQPHSRLPGPSIWGHTSCSVFLSFCSFHPPAVSLCVSYCRVAKTHCPHYANAISAAVCGQVLVKKLKFSKTVLCLFAWGAGVGCSPKVLQPRKSYFRV